VGAPAEPTSGVRFPQARDRLSVTETTSEAARPKTMAMPETEITFSSGLADRALKKAVPLTFEYRAAQAADSTRVLLGVDDQGTVRFTVLQRSSGDPNLDNLAMTHLRSMVFSPAAAPMSWGFATFSWGNEAYTAAPSTP
jgi:outer membrane biosynthesis protein TonB